MSWWAWLGLLLLAWTLLGVGMSLWLGLGIGEADRHRPHHGELTPEAITDPGTSPGLPLLTAGDRRSRGRRSRVGSRPAGSEDGRPPPPTEDRP